MVFTAPVVLAAVGLLSTVANGSPSFQALIPNGNQVPHPCDRSRTWPGVGHENPDGGGAPNPFGVDFYLANKTWTPTLCRKDSDGDGISNGEELGDPFCVWSSGALPSVRDLSQITHPGVCEPINSGICAGKNEFLTRYCPSGIPATTTPGRTNMCTPPGSPSNSYVVNNSPSLNGMRYVAGDFIQYDCNLGYKMTGVPTVYCLRDGSWTQLPSCTIPSIIPRTIGVCPPVAIPERGLIVFSSTQQANGLYAAGDRIAYGCLTGYVISGNANITCLQNGSWSNARPTCVVPDVNYVSPAVTFCPAPPTPVNGYIVNRTPLQIYQQYAIGEQLQYACQSGFSISNRAMITCLSDGSWSLSIPTCLPSFQRGLRTMCPRPQLEDYSFIAATSGMTIADDYEVGEILQIRCQQGYTISTIYSTVQCMGDGFWHPSAMPQCRRSVRDPTGNFCSAPNAPDHGAILGGQSPAPNGDVNYGVYAVGDEVRFVCITGYRMVGDPIIRCQPDGRWLGRQLPTCNRAPIVDTSVTCLLPNSPPNALIKSQTRPWEGNRYIIGSFIAYNCSAGYAPTGRATIMCNRDGSWTRNEFSCTRLPAPPAPNITCEAPPSPDNAYIFASSPSQGKNLYAIGDFIQYTCMDGFASDDRPIAICQTNGQFEPQVTMNCVRIARPPAGAITCLAPSIASDNMLVQVSPFLPGNRYTVGESIQYACQDGYSTSDLTILQCTNDGSWSALVPQCRSNGKYSPTTTPCNPVRVPDNAYILNSAPTRLYFAGDTIQFGCNDGFQLVGTTFRSSCLADGSWSQTFFVCQRNVRVAVTITTCDPPLVPPNGYIVSRSISLLGLRYSTNDYVQYACNTGFQLAGNSTNVCNRDGSWSGPPTCLRIVTPSF